MHRVLIANRGEIAVRIARAVAEAGMTPIGLCSQDEAYASHLAPMAEVITLTKEGAQAYLDIENIVEQAQRAGVDAIHPGYGFLSESAAFATAVEAAELVFIGPKPATLKVFGDKSRARALALECGAKVLRGTQGAVSLEQAQQWVRESAVWPVMLKAVSGGGGRGQRLARSEDELANAFERASSEARVAFGAEELYAEEFLEQARHVEVQVIGDGSGAASHLWDRECSLQRRYQKVVEWAPCDDLPQTVREEMLQGAVRLAQAVSLRGLATMEFLYSASSAGCFFIECNPRLQVEHTVTEEILSLDLVRLQLEIAQGRSLADLDLQQEQIPSPAGHAIQMRLNAESMAPDGQVRPSSGALSFYAPPTGPGVRTDSHIHSGYVVSANYDSLLAKVVVHASRGGFQEAVQRASLALQGMRVEGVVTNLPVLRALMADEHTKERNVSTDFIETHIAELLAVAQASGSATDDSTTSPPSGQAGVRLGTDDPLAVLDYGKNIAAGTDTAGQSTAPEPIHQQKETLPDGWFSVDAPMQGSLTQIAVEEGQALSAGAVVVVMEAMKMEHEIRLEQSGVVQRLGASVGDTVVQDHPLLYLQAVDVDEAVTEQGSELDLEHIREDLQEVVDRKAASFDENRSQAVAKRHERGHRTARENIADLCDQGSFVEYGSVTVAAQRRRRSMEDLISNTTTDGLVCGMGRVNGHLFDNEQARILAMSYDYMILAGTQGRKNHLKKDRMFELAARLRLPTVLFAEGGGGRPGDTDGDGVAGLDNLAWRLLAQLSALVPIVGITNGYCFAGNAVLLGLCDLIIATRGSNIGIGGPAMIEGGGLGVFHPKDVGPLDVQAPNGVVDIVVEDEAEAVDVSKRYLAYFQGDLADWEAPDSRLLRFIVPENRLRYYDMRKVIEGIADINSVLELREHWGIGIITVLIRVEGRSLGVIANNPGHLAGAVDAPGADKAARFMQLCDAHNIPILTLIDCPGIMVGPEIEKTALVRHASRLFMTGANIDVPLMSIVIRKAYGLGAMAMAGSDFKLPLFTLTWPTGEFGGMGLEGAVKLGYRKELMAIEDPAERQAHYEKLVAESYERGKAVNMASHLELDDVIDPADTRRYISAVLRDLPPRRINKKKKRPFIDTW